MYQNISIEALSIEWQTSNAGWNNCNQNITQRMKNKKRKKQIVCFSSTFKAHFVCVSIRFVSSISSISFAFTFIKWISIGKRHWNKNRCLSKFKKLPGSFSFSFLFFLFYKTVIELAMGSGVYVIVFGNFLSEHLLIFVFVRLKVGHSCSLIACYDFDERRAWNAEIFK